MPEQADGIGSPIDDQSKQVEDVASEDAHVEGFHVDETGKLASEYGFAILIVSEADSRLEHDRVSHSSDAAQSIEAFDRLKMKIIQDIGAEDSAVGTCIDEKASLRPRTIPRQDLDSNDGPDHAVIAKVPFSIDAHRCGTSFPWECIR